MTTSPMTMTAPRSAAGAVGRRPVRMVVSAALRTPPPARGLTIADLEAIEREWRAMEAAGLLVGPWPQEPAFVPAGGAP